MIKILQNIVTVALGIVFVISAGMSVLFGFNAMPVIKPTFAVAAGRGSLNDHMQVMRACRLYYCTEYVANLILAHDPHNVEAIALTTGETN